MLAQPLPDGRVPVLLSAHDETLIAQDAWAILGYLDRIAPGHDPTAEVASTLIRLRRVRRHRAVVRASRNELLIAFFDAIAQAVHAMTESYSLYSPEVHREVVRVHERVVAAIAAQDPEAAFRRMQGHVSTYRALVTQAADESRGSPSRKNGRKAAPRSRRT